MERGKEENIKTRYKKLQNGSDVRGFALSAPGEQQNLFPTTARHIGAAFVFWLAERTGKSAEKLRIGIGHDSRITALELTAGVAAGILEEGAGAFVCGLVTTPATFLSTMLPESSFDGAVMVTASHLPYNRNGLKFFTRDGGLEKNAISEILELAAVRAEATGPARAPLADVVTAVRYYEEQLSDKEEKPIARAGFSAMANAEGREAAFARTGMFDAPDISRYGVAGETVYAAKAGGLEREETLKIPASCQNLPGKLSAFRLAEAYSRHMRELICREVASENAEKPLAGLHIIVDAGNGAAGFFATRILEPLGADVSGSVYLEPDGYFPNHVPNPENPEAMAAVSKAVVTAGADLGVIFDCDGDRAAVVFSDGQEVNRNALIALISAIVAEEHPRSTIVTDSVTSDELTEFLEKKLGLVHFRYRRGYKNVIDRAIALGAMGTDCQLAMETSGHGALKENYFSDDGAYLSVKIISKMASLRKEGRRIEDLIRDLGKPAEAREVRIRITGTDFHAYGEDVLDAFARFAREEGWKVVEPNYEGVRIAFDDDEVKGWLLLRLSLHDPILPLNLETAAAGGVDILLERIRPFFAEYERLVLPEA